MDILIISSFCRGFEESDNNRFQYIANILAENNDVELLTSNFRHGTKSHFIDTTPEKKYKVTMLHEPGYKKNVSLKRFYSHYLWGVEVKKYLKSRKKPDVIYCAVPTLKAAAVAAKYCKDNRIKFVIDIQDLWPEAFKMVFNVPMLSNLLFAPFDMIANRVYSLADVICAVSDTYVSRARKVNKICDKFLTVYLGTELYKFDQYVAQNEPVIKDENILMAYCGTLGSSYDLTCVFDAMRIMNEKSPRLVVMGRGPKKEAFEQYAKKYGLDVIFTDALPYSIMCATLAKCDIAINPISHGAAQSIINKHSDYAAAGIPVISTQECHEYRELVDTYKMGFNCNNNDPKDIADKILYLIDNPSVRLLLGKNSRRCAEERFDRTTTYKNIISAIIE